MSQRRRNVAFSVQNHTEASRCFPFSSKNFPVFISVVLISCPEELKYMCIFW